MNEIELLDSEGNVIGLLEFTDSQWEFLVSRAVQDYIVKLIKEMLADVAE